MNLRKHAGWIVAGAMVLMGAGYGSIVLLGPNGTPIGSVVCTAGCSQTNDVLTVNASGGSGYATIDDENTPLTQRTTLNFAGAGVVCADDTTQTTCTISGAAGSFYATVQEEGTPLTQRPTINFIGSSITCVDNAGNTRTDCTITGGSGGLDHPAVMVRAMTAFGGF